MLLNVSNHTFSEWTADQVEEAKKAYGDIIDIPFPHVPPDCSDSAIIQMARDIVVNCVKLARERGEPTAIHVMGEMTLTYALVRLFQQNGFECIASVTERKYKLNGIGFVFMGFRKYPNV